MKQPTITFTNGVEIPQIGIGTWQAPEGETTRKALEVAFDVGYRHIDTAAIYGNEETVGAAVSASSLKRDELFITTKVWNNDQGYDSTLKAHQASLQRLGLDYVDLYLIHWPQHDTTADTWRAMEYLLEQGGARAIGVCNFYQHHLEHLFTTANIKPMINQFELHPWMSVPEEQAFCRKNDIIIEAWAPIARAQHFDDPLIQELVEKYNRTPAQIILRWDIQNGFVTIPKSVTPSRIEENFQIFDFELSEEDMKRIDGLNDNDRIGPHPDRFN